MFRSMFFALLLFVIALPAAAQETPPPIMYESAFIPPEFSLNVRSSSGYFSGEVVDFLTNGVPITITGAGETPNGRLWVPVSYGDGVSGWIERRFVTGYIAPEEFCADSRVPELIAALQQAIWQRDGEQLASLVSPRGLYIAQYRDASVHLTQGEVSNFFLDGTPRAWERLDVGMGAVVIETLNGEVTDKLQRDLLPENITIACNNNQDGLSIQSSLYAVQIPGYEARNFYTILRPGEPGNELDWGAWGIVIEYWDDQPVIMALGYYVWVP